MSPNLHASSTHPDNATLVGPLSAAHKEGVKKIVYKTPLFACEEKVVEQSNDRVSQIADFA